LFEKITKVNQVWLTDFCALTRRFAYSGMSRRYFDKSLAPQKHGDWHKKGMKPNATYYPKWSRYAFKRNENHTDNIKIYSQPIYMFAIQDAYSRFIIHACLRECPKGLVATMPHWFKLDDCFQESFSFQEPLKRLGKPFEFIMDAMIYCDYVKKLQGNSFVFKKVRTSNHYLLSPLDAFFGRLQIEMRGDLTNRTLEKYIDYYNYERPHSSLNGKTPADYFFSSSVFW